MRNNVCLCSLLYLPPSAALTWNQTQGGNGIYLFENPTQRQQKWKVVRAWPEPLQAKDEPTDFK